MRVVLSSRAEIELEILGDHIALDNPRRAVSFVQEIRTRCEALADMPARYSLVPRYEASGVRRAVHGDYLIFYTVTAEAVVILHIVHGQVDYARLLSPDE